MEARTYNDQDWAVSRAPMMSDPGSDRVPFLLEPKSLQSEILIEIEFNRAYEHQLCESMSSFWFHR